MRSRLLTLFLAVCLLAWVSLAGASSYSLWVNGRTGGGVTGNDASNHNTTYNVWFYLYAGCQPGPGRNAEVGVS